MTTILNGLLGGLLMGTIAATVTAFVAGEPPVIATISRRAVGPDRSSFRWIEFTAWMLYGGFAGGVLVALELFVLQFLAVPPTTVEAFGVVGVWSIFLFGILTACWRIGLFRSHFDELLVYHFVYGTGLGFWIRLTWIT
ncbi:MAG: hypothetical protein ABEH65_12425 [Halobacteriales archaeon]